MVIGGMIGNGGAGLTPAGNTKQDKIFTYTVANLTDLNAITGMVANNTAITLDTLKTYIYTNQWDEVLSSSSATNLSIINKTATTFDIESDTGNDITIPEATITEAGLLNAADKIKINNTPYSITIVPTQADMLALTSAEVNKSVVYVSADKIQYQLIALPSSNIANWSAIASNIDVGNDGTNDTVPNSAQMQSYVTQALLNTPNLPFVHFATTSNDILSGLLARDGYTPVAGNFALVKNQTNNDNSVYRVTSSGAWVRQYYDTATDAWSNINIVTQTTYSDLKIDGGIVNVLNGTVNKNLQYQFSIVNKSAIFGSSIVYVMATTKIPPRDIFNGYVSRNIGNDTNFNGSASFPYATVTKALSGASFPAIINIAPSGNVYTDIMSITAGQSNLSLIANDTLDAGKTQFSNPITLQTGNTRYKEKGITRSVGSATPIVIAANNLGRHTFENCIWATSGNSLMSIDASVINWINLYNIDAGGSPLASIPLPNFTTGFVFNIYNQTKYLPFSLVAGSTGANCTINIYNSLKGAVVIPHGFTGTINYFDGYSINEIITDQTRLNTILADTTLSGFYAVSFASPTGMTAGCIFNKISASGFTVNNITETFANGKTSSIYDLNTKKTFFKDGSGGFNGWSAAGSGSGSDPRYMTITHTLGAAVQRLKSVKKINGNYVLGDCTDAGSGATPSTASDRITGLMLVVEVINSTTARVFNGSGQVILPYAISTIYPTITSANIIGSLAADLYLNTTGDLVRSDQKPTAVGTISKIGEFINDNELQYVQLIQQVSPNVLSTVVQQVEGNKKQYVLTSGKKTGISNSIMSLATTTVANDSIQWDATSKVVQGKFGGETVNLMSSGSLIKKLATQIPVFGGSVVNPNLDPAIANINTQGAQNYIFAINSALTLFAIPSPVATPNSKFVDAIGDISVLTAGQIGFELNPLQPYRHNGSAIEVYDFILMGKATWNGSLFSNVINYAFNGKEKLNPPFPVGTSTSYTYQHNLGTDDFDDQYTAKCLTPELGYLKDEVVNVGSIFTHNSSNHMNPSIRKTSTTLKVITYTGFGGLSITGGTNQPFTPARWDFFIDCNRKY